MRAYRLHRSHRAASDYAGALLYPGRWHPRGTPVLYFSLALSLACLERLVHLAPGEIPDDYAYTRIELNIEPELSDYRGSLREIEATRAYGRRWAVDQRSLAILVPSAVIPIEFNILVNPLHHSFGEVVWEEPKHFGFDERLLRK